MLLSYKHASTNSLKLNCVFRAVLCAVPIPVSVKKTLLKTVLTSLISGGGGGGGGGGVARDDTCKSII